MRLPMTARTPVSLLALIVASSVALAGCSADATAPTTDPLQPTSAAASAIPLTSLSNGTYTFTVNPAVSNTLTMGEHRLSLPANAICDLQTAGYGTGMWSNACVPETSPVTITAVVTTSLTDHARIDFSPAMRFSPATAVELYVWDAKASGGTAKRLNVLYCPSALLGGNAATGPCVDESTFDSDLTTSFVPGTYYLKRRVKHFSGYVVAE